MRMIDKCFKVAQFYCEKGYYKPFVFGTVAVASTIGSVVAFCFNPYIAIPVVVVSIVSTACTIVSVDVPPGCEPPEKYVMVPLKPSAPEAHEVFVEIAPAPTLVFSKMNVNRPNASIETINDVRSKVVCKM